MFISYFEAPGNLIWWKFTTMAVLFRTAAQSPVLDKIINIISLVKAGKPLIVFYQVREACSVST